MTGDWQSTVTNGLIVASLLAVIPICWFEFRNNGDVAKRLLKWVRRHRIASLLVPLGLMTVVVVMAPASDYLTRRDSIPLQVTGVVLLSALQVLLVALCYAVYFRAKRLPHSA